MKDLLNELEIIEIRLEAKQSKKAEKLVNIIFKNTFDLIGRPYIEHIYAVASGFNDEERYTTGLLHDILEDTKMTINDLVMLGFREMIVNNVILLTKEEDSYEKYIDKLVTSSNTVVLDIKLSDLKHNLKEERLNKLNEEKRQTLKDKYLKAYDKISKRREELIW